MSRQKKRSYVAAAGISLAVFINVLVPCSLWSDSRADYYRFFRFPSFVQNGSIQAHWMNDGHSFWYAEGSRNNTVIYKVDPIENTKKPLFNAQRLRQALIPVLGNELSQKGLPFQTFAFVEGEKIVEFIIEKKKFRMDLDSYTVRPAPSLSKEKNIHAESRKIEKRFYSEDADLMEVSSPNSLWFLGTENYNLYLRSQQDSRLERLTEDGLKDREWTVRGTRWSPDSRKIAVKKMDLHQVHRFPIVHWLSEEEEVEWLPYTKTGEPLPGVEIYIFDIQTKNKTRVETSDPENPYIDIIGWLPDSSELIFTKSSRVWDKLELRAANPETGSVRLILKETSKTFLGGLGRSLSPLFLEEGKRFIWASERDGWKHFFLYDIEGNLICQLTQGDFPVVDVAAVDEKEGWIYFKAHAEERPYDTHLYRVDMEGGGFSRLTERTGQHSIQFSPSYKYFLDNHSSITRPPVAELRQADGTLVQTLSRANIDALKRMNWTPPEEFVVKAADQKTDLYGVLFKPCGFDPQKKYPVIDYIYNGPNRTHVPRAFTSSLWPRAMAQMGCVVLVVDGRGTPERGKAFQDVVYRNFGRHEIPDHKAVLKELANKRPYMDLSRVGLLGGSWGGYMTIRAMLMASNIYHVGIAYYPVADLYDHTRGVERYMGLPEDNSEGYENASNIRLAKNLKGKLLLIAGTSDVNAPFTATMKMADAFIKAEKSFDLIVIPEQDHSLRGNGQYILEAARRYFEEHLLPLRKR
ncbi:DPP IV N-terminal domain-containing protein [Acidobacteriota bacterium]